MLIVNVYLIQLQLQPSRKRWPQRYETWTTQVPKPEDPWVRQREKEGGREVERGGGERRVRRKEKIYMHTLFASCLIINRGSNICIHRFLMVTKLTVLLLRKLHYIPRLRGTSLSGGAGVHLGDVLATLPKLEWIEYVSICG